ncbi:MAG TPA: hypothetical protein VGY77_01130 [Gemmataceae bacterium]|jgi:hypothetical protein|nr:hypothetical protein [Gemmataceae bacterium]
MFGYEYILALTLITAPPNSLDSVRDSYLLAKVRTSLQEAAIKNEILDPKEVRYILARPEDFFADVHLLQRRFRELADAPALHDGLRFPDRDLVNELLAFNRAYRQHLSVRQPVELAKWWEIRTAIQETDFLYQVWDTVRDARCDYYYVTVRRQALKKLRTMLGEDKYYQGQLPPHVPLWRFQEID